MTGTLRRMLLATAAVVLWPALALAQGGQVVEYYHTDALGSVRAVTKVVNGQVQVVSRHDYMPFGEEVSPPPPPSEKRLFTGKERDAETGLDYFGARYLRAAQGRFASSDPLIASEKTTDPQTFNRYAYGLNNPLRFRDPDGLEVPKACIDNPSCVIVLKVNLVYDTRAGDGSGLRPDQIRGFMEFQYERAKKMYGTANIRIDVVDAKPGMFIVAGGEAHISAESRRFDALNVAITDGLPYNARGDTFTDRDGTFAIGINIDTALGSASLPVLNTFAHELMHRMLNAGEVRTDLALLFFRVFSRICGSLRARVADPTCGTGRFPPSDTTESRTPFWWSVSPCC